MIRASIDVESLRTQETST